MRYAVLDGTLVIELEGRIDSYNAPTIERDIVDAVADASPASIELEASRLSYIASSGLRMLMELLKRYGRLSITNVSPDIYEILHMTGIGELMTVTREHRSVSLEGLRQIGAGAFGRVYRLDDERVMKVYDPAVVPLERIERERQSAREAFIHGIPSAIPFETVRVGDENGIIYELIDARTLGETLSGEPHRLEELALRMARLLKTLHETRFKAGMLPDSRLIFHGWIDVAAKSGLYARETIDRLRQLVDGIPPCDTFVHGDFHPANIMVMADGELMLIDMGDASVGDPIIDLAGMYHVVRVAARRPGGAERLCGMPAEALDRLWGIFVRTYFDVSGDDEVEAIERRLRFAALPRTMGSTARSKLITDEARRQQAAELERLFLAGLEQRA